MGKLKSHGDSDHSDEERKGLKDLLAKPLKTKRRRKRELKEVEERENEEAARGRDVAERGRLDNNDAAGSFTSRDQEEDDEHDNDGSSLLTYESETES